MKQPKDAVKVEDAVAEAVEVAKEVIAKEKKAREMKPYGDAQFMTDEELAREIINAGSVHYKAAQRNAPEDLIAYNAERVAIAKAERDKRRAAKALEALAAAATPVEVEK